MRGYDFRSTYQYRAEYRRAAEQWLAQAKFELHATLAFPHNVGIVRGRHILRHWFACLDSYYLGKNWHLHPSDERTSAIIFVEDMDSNLHYHCLLRLPESAQGQSPLQQCSILERHWTAAVPLGSCRAKPIYDLPRAARYVTKQLVRPGYDVQFILATEFHKARE